MDSERIEPGAQAARRDDLARDVARLWLGWRAQQHLQTAVGWLDEPLRDALDRLAAASGWR